MDSPNKDTHRANTWTHTLSLSLTYHESMRHSAVTSLRKYSTTVAVTARSNGALTNQNSELDLCTRIHVYAHA